MGPRSLTCSAESPVPRSNTGSHFHPDIEPFRVNGYGHLVMRCPHCKMEFQTSMTPEAALQENF